MNLLVYSFFKVIFIPIFSEPERKKKIIMCFLKYHPVFLFGLHEKGELLFLLLQ